MRSDDGLCWLCDDPLTSERASTSWHGFGAHRDCARRMVVPAAADGEAGGLDKADVIVTTT